jgi:hypothetical protein
MGVTHTVDHSHHTRMQPSKPRTVPMRRSLVQVLHRLQQRVWRPLEMVCHPVPGPGLVLVPGLDLAGNDQLPPHEEPIKPKSLT